MEKHNLNEMDAGLDPSGHAPSIQAVSYPEISEKASGAGPSTIYPPPLRKRAREGRARPGTHISL